MHERALLGYRVWQLDDSKLLSSGMGESHWSRLNEAHCRQKKPHAAPDKNCECGLYSFYNIESAKHQAKHLKNPILGAIALSGDVQLHWNGSRAQRAQILALLGAADAIREVANKLDVPYFDSGEGFERFIEDHSALVKDSTNFADQLPAAPLKASQMQYLINQYPQCENIIDYLALADQLKISLDDLWALSNHFGLCRSYHKGSLKVKMYNYLLF